MQTVKNMSQERMEWLERVGIRSVEDIKANGAQNTYQLLIDEGHPEDEHFYCALLGAIENRDTIDIWRSMKEQKDSLLKQ
ncbi:MAG: TfoX C-terminal domain [Parcubacteria group bacterium]|nr:TfoX C-terminal domain [Parcubacteria group bacterium]